MEDKYSVVANRARNTFNEIKLLRKTMPQHTKAERDLLQTKIKEFQDRWWEEVKPIMAKDYEI